MQAVKGEVVVFDLDDVLFNARVEFQKALCALTGKDIPWQWWHSFDLNVAYPGVGYDKILQAFEEHQCLEKAKAEVGAVEAIQYYRERGYKIAALTARGWHPNGKRVTEQALADNGLDVDDLYLVGDSKAGALTSRYESVFLYVDDHADHIKAAQAHNVHCYLQDRPWNQHYNEAPRIYSLFDLITH